MSTVGYSGRPLVDKLGIKPGDTVYAIRAPENYESLLSPLPTGTSILRRNPTEPVKFVHFFTTGKEHLAAQADGLVRNLAPGGTLWISWPKKSSKVPTDVTEDTLREVLLPLGIVDVKVCAVDETWSGLKFLWRKN